MHRRAQNVGEDVSHVLMCSALEASLGGVSTVDIDGKNTLQIKARGVVISTFETRPTHALVSPNSRPPPLSQPPIVSVSASTSPALCRSQHISRDTHEEDGPLQR